MKRTLITTPSQNCHFFMRNHSNMQVLREADRARAIMRAMQIGEKVPDFELPDLEGTRHTLSSLRGKSVILNFWSSDCPHVERTDQLINGWREGWKGRVAVVSIASNANETPARLREEAQRRGLPLVLVDGEQRVADLFEAATTPQVFVIDAEGALRYRGAVDDASFARREPTRYYLEEVVEALLRGDAAPLEDTQPYGCALIRQALE